MSKHSRASRSLRLRVLRCSDQHPTMQDSCLPRRSLVAFARLGNPDAWTLHYPHATSWVQTRKSTIISQTLRFSQLASWKLTWKQFGFNLGRSFVCRLMSQPDPDHELLQPCSTNSRNLSITEKETRRHLHGLPFPPLADPAPQLSCHGNGIDTYKNTGQSILCLPRLVLPCSGGGQKSAGLGICFRMLDIVCFTSRSQGRDPALLSQEPPKLHSPALPSPAESTCPIRSMQAQAEAVGLNRLAWLWAPECQTRGFTYIQPCLVFAFDLLYQFRGPEALKQRSRGDAAAAYASVGSSNTRSQRVCTRFFCCLYCQNSDRQLWVCRKDEGPSTLSLQREQAGWTYSALPVKTTRIQVQLPEPPTIFASQ